MPRAEGGEAATGAFKELISADLVRLIGRHLDDPAGFEAAVVPRLPALEMKARVEAIRDALLDHLPEEPEARHARLRDMLHPDVRADLKGASDERGIAGWGIWPLSLVVGEHGGAAFEDAMETLRLMTQRSTAEFAIRPLIDADQDRALGIMAGWVEDPSHHVRRLVSEGTRPRLPWGMRLRGLVADPSPVLRLLARLRDDPSDYVRRSVANHLGDVAKDHPALAVEVARDWMRDAPQTRVALLRHALRHPIKGGDADALALFGWGPPRLAPVAVTVDRAVVRMGEEIVVAADLTSTATGPQDLAVDLVLHLVKANGRTAPKVFKGAVLRLGPGETARFARTHRFREVTTRRAHGGRHAVGLRINGVDTPTAAFDLIV
ncbi:DNA alkylation repair protein [Jannaschia sp. Os4]|uniref:DNA alkylation repair protein n=1 Tax=Jannaschia sp. Os4 TaxID=2807617 RepID=UPI001939EFD9|nr:DNA alkylation repair protein [Jannaschia sp. Os4]MBM2575720.1 DNA alkylation repair protein [Jannaschia sp. Os4]